MSEFTTEIYIDLNLSQRQVNALQVDYIDVYERLDILRLSYYCPLKMSLLCCCYRLNILDLAFVKTYQL